MRRQHQPVTFDDNRYDVSHLNSHTVYLLGKGREHGADLSVEIIVSCHAYSKRCLRGETSDLIDHLGNHRTFCLERHALSNLLPNLISDSFNANSLTYPVKDRNENSNLTIFDLSGGQRYCVFYHFQPSSRPNIDVTMNVVSAYERKTVNRTKGNNISYFARRCMFRDKRVP